MDDRATLPTSRHELLLYVCFAASVLIVFSEVLLHPGQILYSTGSDILAQHYPYRHLMVDSLRSKHRLPMWNPTAFCGMPLIGDPQAGLLYPPNWLHALSKPDDTGGWFGYLIIAHLIVGGWGVLWWLQLHGFHPWTRLAGAWAFVFCGKWILHILVPGHVIFLPLVYLPWQMGLVDRLWLRPSLRLTAWLAIVTALSILGSHSQQLYYSQWMLLLYTAVSAGVFRSKERLLRSALFLIVAGLMALLLSANHLLPIFDLLDKVVRGQGVSYEMAARRSQTWSDYLTFLLPNKAENGHWENTSYVGVCAAALAAFGLLGRGRVAFRAFFATAIVLSLLYALGEHGYVHRLLFDYAPGFHLFRIPTRIFLLLGVPVAYLTAAGMERLITGTPTWGCRGLAIGLGLIALLALKIEISWDSAFAAAALGGVTIIALLPRSVAHARWATAALLALLGIDQARFVIPLVETKSLAQALGENPLVQRIAAPLGKQRFVALNYSRPGMYSALPITYATPHRLESVRGFNPLIPDCSFRYVRTGIAQEEYKGFYGTGIREFELASLPHLDLLNVRWIISDKPLSLPGLELRELYRNLRVYHFSALDTGLTALPQTYLYENTNVLPRAMLVREAVLIQKDTIAAVADLDPRQRVLVEHDGLPGQFPGEFQEVAVDHRGDELFIEVDAGEGGYLVLSEMWYPGWQATVDGVRQYPFRANSVFLGLKIPPGQHRIHLWYCPTAYQWGWWISLGTWLAVGVLLLCPFATKR